jgi:DNA transformation protein and related proteins
MTSDLSTCVNIGKDTEAKLMEAGIDSFQQLQAIGSEGAFLRLQAYDPGACLHLLYALDGAVSGVRKKDLPPERKQALLQFYKSVKK